MYSFLFLLRCLTSVGAQEPEISFLNDGSGPVVFPMTRGARLDSSASLFLFYFTPFSCRLRLMTLVFSLLGDLRIVVPLLGVLHSFLLHRPRGVQGCPLFGLSRAFSSGSHLSTTSSGSTHLCSPPCWKTLPALQLVIIGATPDFPPDFVGPSQLFLDDLGR